MGMKPRKKGVHQQQQAARNKAHDDPPLAPRKKIAGKTINPAAQVYPLLTDKELRALADDIEARGMRHPIVLDAKGRILDGRNRLLACQLAKVAPKFKTWKGADPWSFVRSENEHRRHLSESQRAICEVLWREGYEAWLAASGKTKRSQSQKAAVAGRKRERSGKFEKGKNWKSGKGATLPPCGDSRISPSTRSAKEKAREANKTRAAVAEAAHVSPRTAQKAITLAKQDPNLARAVVDGKTTLTEAHRQLRKKTATRAPLPKGKFRVLYVDVPWKYDNAGLDDAYGHAERHYDSMSIAELCAMPVKDVVAKDAVLFFWVTSPMLPECWPIIKAWGFTCKSQFIWDKDAHNYGHYNSVRHELLLVCTRGSCLPEVSTLIPSVQRIKKSRKHSEKPEQFRKIIETLYPSGRKLELFGRKKVKGWTVFGDQIETPASASKSS